MNKSKIVLDKTTGILKSVILSDPDLAKCNVKMFGNIEMVNNEMTLCLKMKLNDSFQIEFE